MSLGYKPDFQIFSTYRHLNSWNHSFNASLVHQITPRWTLEAAEFGLITQDPTRSLTDGLFLIPRGRFAENMASLTISRSMTPKTTLSLGADNTITSMTVSATDSPERLNQMGTSGTVSLTHRFTMRQQLSAGFSQLWLTPLDDITRSPAIAANSSGNAQFLNATYSYTFNPDLTVQLSGGAFKGETLSYSASGQIDKQVGGVRITAGYSRFLSFFDTSAFAGNFQFANGALPKSIYQVVTFRASGNLSRRVGLELSVAGSRNHSPVFDQDLEALSGRARLDFGLTDRVRVFVNAERYHQNVNQLLDLPVARRTYFAGIEIALSRLPSATNRSRAPK